jgi:hypothetical protein
MSFEAPTTDPTPEKGPKFLSLAEITAKIEAHVGQENLKVQRTLEDANGVYLHEVVTVDDAGDASVYSYRRVGNFSETKTSNTVLDVAYYQGSVEDDICIGGTSLSNYDETTGLWTDC